MSLPRYDNSIAGNLLSLNPLDLSLEGLADEIKALLQIREKGRIALAVRLSIAHRLISTGQTPERSFVAWCKRNVVLNGKPIGPHSIWRLVKIGDAKNPTKAWEAIKAEEREKQKAKMARITAEAVAGRNVVAIKTGKAAAPLKSQNISADVSQEINAIMTAWEHASEMARRQFLYMIGASAARKA